MKKFIILFSCLFNLAYAKEKPATLEQINFYNGDSFKLVALLSYYTYPSNQIAKFAIKFNVENPVILNGVLDEALVRLELLEITPDSDTMNDGVAQIFCGEIFIGKLLENWLTLKGLKGYNKFKIKINLPPGNLKMNIGSTPFECSEYKKPEIIFN